jgi:hypothetical protein
MAQTLLAVATATGRQAGFFRSLATLPEETKTGFAVDPWQSDQSVPQLWSCWVILTSRPGLLLASAEGSVRTFRRNADLGGIVDRDNRSGRRRTETSEGKESGRFGTSREIPQWRSAR